MDKQKKSTVLTLVVLALLGTAYHFLWHDGDGTSEAAPDEMFLGETGGSDAAAGQHGLLELPYRLEDDAGCIVEHMGYTLSYNSSYRVPNWVAYELLSSELYSGDRKREDEFNPDPLVKGRQAYDRDYVGSGFDRGHMAPAGDMKWSSQAMKECFYLSNICPQVHGLNAGAWNDLEKQVRREAKYYGAVWVACGPIFDSSNPDHIGENHVMVPDSFFKALLARKKDGSGYIAIGFIFPNKNCTRNLTLYAMTVDELERKTGLDFFYNLDSSEQEKAESVMDPYGDWRIRDEVLRD
jgi:DNA/RNA endonuclease G, NUC1